VAAARPRPGEAPRGSPLSGVERPGARNSRRGNERLYWTPEVGPAPPVQPGTGAADGGLPVRPNTEADTKAPCRRGCSVDDGSSFRVKSLSQPITLCADVARISSHEEALWVPGAGERPDAHRRNSGRPSRGGGRKIGVPCATVSVVLDKLTYFVDMERNGRRRRQSSPSAPQAEPCAAEGGRASLAMSEPDRPGRINKRRKRICGM
jgi:hypothetical protein